LVVSDGEHVIMGRDDSDFAIDKGAESGEHERLCGLNETGQPE
jgi:hypothetical protein